MTIRKPDDVRRVVVDGQHVTLFRFDAASPVRPVHGRLTGSVSKVIECDINRSDLQTIPSSRVPPGSFGFGGAASAGDDAVDNQGEAFGMDGRFFFARPSRVGAHDPYTSTDGAAMTPFFFQADFNLGAHPPRLARTESGTAMEGELPSGTVFAFEAEQPVRVISMLEGMLPDGLSAIYFRGQARAADIVDKILKVSPTPAHRKSYGRITTPQGLEDFFVMKTIPQGFAGTTEVVAFGAAFRSVAGEVEKPVPNMDELLNRLFYFTPGTVRGDGVSIHMHGLILDGSDGAPIADGESLHLSQLPLSYAVAGEGGDVPRSGRIVHLENTTKLASGAFLVAPLADLQLS